MHYHQLHTLPEKHLPADTFPAQWVYIITGFIPELPIEEVKARVEKAYEEHQSECMQKNWRIGYMVLIYLLATLNSDIIIQKNIKERFNQWLEPSMLPLVTYIARSYMVFGDILNVYPSIYWLQLSEKQKLLLNADSIWLNEEADKISQLPSFSKKELASVSEDTRAQALIELSAYLTETELHFVLFFDMRLIYGVTANAQFLEELLVEMYEEMSINEEEVVTRANESKIIIQDYLKKLLPSVSAVRLNEMVRLLCL